jgi:hypothetical protein
VNGNDFANNETRIVPKNIESVSVGRSDTSKDLLSSSNGKNNTPLMPVANDEKPTIQKNEVIRASQEEALDYIKNVSNVLRNINFDTDTSQNSTKNSNLAIYNPKLRIVPELDSFMSDDLYYLVQAKNSFSFYLESYFVDNFGVTVPESIYKNKAEIYYTIDNSDPFTSTKRVLYEEGTIFKVDRNMNIKIVVMSDSSVSPVYTIQFSIVKDPNKDMNSIDMNR